MKVSPWICGLLTFAAALAWSRSTEAAVVKAVQSGTVSMSALTQSVAITSVNTSKAFVICQITAPNGSQASDRVTCELNSATVLTVTTGAVRAPPVVVQWYVVEFLSGVSVQRGLAAFGTGTAAVDVPLTAISLNNSFALVTTVTASGSKSIDEQFTPTVTLTTTTNLHIARFETGTSMSAAWQVVQIDSAAVQSGTLNMPQASVTAAAALNPAVDITRTFLVFTANGNTGIGGVESRYQTTGVITNSTTLTFARALGDGVGNDINIAWFAVRMTDGTTVQGNNPPSPKTTLTAATNTMNVTITSIATNQSVPILSTSGDPGRTNNNDMDDTVWAGAFTSTTNLQLTKSTSASNNSLATVAWQVVQFNNKPNLVDGDGREVFP